MCKISGGDTFEERCQQGGLEITSISQTAELEYENSQLMTEEFMELIYELRNIMKLDQKKIKDTLKEVDKRKTTYYGTKQ